MAAAAEFVKVARELSRREPTDATEAARLAVELQDAILCALELLASPAVLPPAPAPAASSSSSKG